MAEQQRAAGNSGINVLSIADKNREEPSSALNAVDHEFVRGHLDILRCQKYCLSGFP